MSHRFGGRALTRLTAAVAWSLIVMATVAPPVAAECNPPGADPSFRKAVPLASRVVIGTVIEVRPDGFGSGAAGPSSRFTLAITHRLRGDAPSIMGVEGLVTNSCIRLVSAALGDEIALALEVRDATPPIALNTAAWLKGVPTGFGVFESITLAEAIALVRQSPPDTATSAEHARERRGVPIVVLIAGAAGGLVSVMKRRTTPAIARGPQGDIAAR